MFSNKKRKHFSDGVLWQFHRNELDQADSRAVAEHIQGCTLCHARLDDLARMIQVMHTAHHQTNPDWAQQLRMHHALRQAATEPVISSVWVDQSKHLLRWLIPSVALLVIAFLLVNPAAKSTPTYWSELVLTSPESRILFPQSEKQMKEDVYKLLVTHY